MTTHALTLRLPEALHEALRVEAFEKRTSITSLVRSAVEQGREKPGGLCDHRTCWNTPTSISSGGFHWCDRHGSLTPQNAG